MAKIKTRRKEISTSGLQVREKRQQTPNLATTQAKARQEKKVNLRSSFFIEEGPCRSGTNFPFAHLSKDDQSMSSKRQPKSDKIKETREGGLVADSPDAEMNVRNLLRHEAAGLPRTVHWSAHEMKVACFQEAHPSRNVVQQRKWNERNPQALPM